MRLLPTTVAFLVLCMTSASGDIAPEPVPELFGTPPDLVLGDRDEGIVFGRIVDVGVGPRGRVYVLDGGFGRVHAFDRSGNGLGTFGRPGEGPGEFTRPLSIAVDPNDGNVWVGNLHGRLCEFTPDGDVVGDIRFSWPGQRAVRSIAVGPNGRLYVACANVSDGSMIHIFEQAGERIASFGPTYAAHDADATVEDAMTYAIGFLDVRDRTIVYVQKNPLEIRTYELDGTLLKTIEDPGYDVPRPPRVLRPDGTRIKRSLKGAWGIVALPRGELLLNIIVPVNDELPVGGSIIVHVDANGSVVRDQSRPTTLVIGAVDESGAVWAFDDHPYARVLRYPGIATDVH